MIGNQTAFFLLSGLKNRPEKENHGISPVKTAGFDSGGNTATNRVGHVLLESKYGYRYLFVMPPPAPWGAFPGTPAVYIHAAVDPLGAFPGTPAVYIHAAVGPLGAFPGTPVVYIYAAVGPLGAFPGTPAVKVTARLPLLQR